MIQQHHVILLLRPRTIYAIPRTCGGLSLKYFNLESVRREYELVRAFLSCVHMTDCPIWLERRHLMRRAGSLFKAILNLIDNFVGIQDTACARRTNIFSWITSAIACKNLERYRTVTTVASLYWFHGLLPCLSCTSSVQERYDTDYPVCTNRKQVFALSFSSFENLKAGWNSSFITLDFTSWLPYYKRSL